MVTISMIDSARLLRDIPSGNWVALSEDGQAEIQINSHLNRAAGRATPQTPQTGSAAKGGELQAIASSFWV